jgi:hypothetical protein
MAVDPRPQLDIVTKTSEGEWRLSGVVDLENAVAGVAGDALLDIAKTFFYSIGESRVKREGFFKVFKGYGEIDRSQWNEQIDLYRLYHALEWWCWAKFTGSEPPTFLMREMERNLRAF